MSLTRADLVAARHRGAATGCMIDAAIYLLAGGSIDKHAALLRVLQALVHNDVVMVGTVSQLHADWLKRAKDERSKL